MLLSVFVIVVDVIPLGSECIMADVTAIVVDVVTTICNWNMTNVADVIATYDCLFGWCYCQSG